MKKKKLTLNVLKVNSFVIDSTSSSHIAGGIQSFPTGFSEADPGTSASIPHTMVRACASLLDSACPTQVDCTP